MEKQENEEALGYYDMAEETRKELGITDSSVSSVYFLKNRGTCLFYLGRHREAVKVLKEACGIIEKLPEDNTRCKVPSVLLFGRGPQRSGICLS